MPGGSAPTGCGTMRGGDRVVRTIALGFCAAFTHPVQRLVTTALVYDEPLPDWRDRQGSPRRAERTIVAGQTAHRNVRRPDGAQSYPHC